ncbi:LysR family transcriptional regulator [Pseudomonas palmensis]|uniref:LysR family transcriptional regulator n=1 Tax=Pseudomonas palmensis TaxID=2815362 RepID=UPI001AE64778|nr:LysR family transcriptional regulator [Pseudomonas palmensis]
MRAFCSIVEVGSFVSAANMLGVPKATISGQVKSLENSLGIALLTRTTRKVEVTATGLAYYEKARLILDDVDDLEALVAQTPTAMRGRIRVKMPSAVGAGVVIPKLPEFISQYPNLFIDIAYSEWAGTDCAVVTSDEYDNDLVRRDIGRLRFCLCASVSYLEAGSAILNVSHLTEHKYLGFRFPGTERKARQRLLRGSEIHEIKQTPYMYFNNGAAVSSATVAGLGVALLPLAEAQPLIANGSIRQILPDWEAESTVLSIVYPKHNRLSSRIKAFAAWLEDIMSRDEVWRLGG